MFTFIKNHGGYKKDDMIGTHPNINYLEKLGVVIKLAAPPAEKKDTKKKK